LYWALLQLCETTLTLLINIVFEVVLCFLNFPLCTPVGYFQRITQETENGRIKLSLKVYNNITELLNQVSEVLKKIVPVVQENDPLFYPALNSPWSYYRAYRFLELWGVSERLESKADDRERYLRCVREVAGSRSSESEPCTISDECWKTMMTKGAPNNVLYYQSLFFILGEAAGMFALNFLTLFRSLNSKYCKYNTQGVNWGGGGITLPCNYLSTCNDFVFPEWC